MPVDRFLSIKEVVRITSLSKTEIYRQIKEQRFPASFPISHQKVAWWEREVEAWQYKKLTEAGRTVPSLLEDIFA